MKSVLGHTRLRSQALISSKFKGIPGYARMHAHCIGIKRKARIDGRHDDVKRCLESSEWMMDDVGDVRRAVITKVRNAKRDTIVVILHGDVVLTVRGFSASVSEMAMAVVPLVPVYPAPSLVPLLVPCGTPVASVSSSVPSSVRYVLGFRPDVGGAKEEGSRHRGGQNGPYPVGKGALPGIHCTYGCCCGLGSQTCPFL